MATGSYALTREQFGRSISQFEGVQEALEPIAGYTYMMDAARLLTSGMLDRGVRPSVPSAVLKYRNTDLMRTVINHAMDVVAGRGVITGPRNFLARAYQAVPIGITVEGANILTRSLMVFGQGAIRCHPFIVEEIEAAGMDDKKAAVEKFDGISRGDTEENQTARDTFKKLGNSIENTIAKTRAAFTSYKPDTYVGNMDLVLSLSRADVDSIDDNRFVTEWRKQIDGELVLHAISVPHLQLVRDGSEEVGNVIRSIVLGDGGGAG
jgi:alkylation response protein AidB-like acyl-CoA dehydrogenase